jgi:prophage DNA circulation protein
MWDPANIRIASFKGVEFPFVQAVSTSRSKRYRSIEYPNCPGGGVWDGARKPVGISMVALFGLWKVDGIVTPAFGNDWRKQVRELVKVCDEIGPGQLVHPIYGQIQALCTDYPDEIRGDEPDQVSMRLTFIEAGHGDQAWQNVIEILNPEARAESRADRIDSDLGLSGDESFGFHVRSFSSMLGMVSVTLDLMESTLAAAMQAITALADTIDYSTDPMRYDYVTEAYSLAGLLVDAADMYVGGKASMKLYLVQREMTAMDVAAACSCTVDDVLQYNDVGDPLSIQSGQYLIVPS